MTPSDDNPEATEVANTDEFEAALGDPEVPAITLTGDIALDSTKTISRDLDLDLNGHKLTGGMLNQPMFNVTSGTLTLTGDGEISNQHSVAVANGEGSTVHVFNGTYTSASNAVFRALNGGTVIFENGEATGREGAITCYGPNNMITVEGGVLTGTDNFAIATNGSSGMGGNYITINGGIFDGNIESTGYEAVGVYIANDDVFEMNGGEIIAHGGTGICMRGGEVTINGGIITAVAEDNNGNPVRDGTIGDDPTVLEGVAAIVYHKASGYAGANGMRLIINDGVINGVDYSIDVIGDDNPDITINGGELTPPYEP